MRISSDSVLPSRYEGLRGACEFVMCRWAGARFEAVVFAITLGLGMETGLGSDPGKEVPVFENVTRCGHEQGVSKNERKGIKTTTT